MLQCFPMRNLLLNTKIINQTPFIEATLPSELVSGNLISSNCPAGECNLLVAAGMPDTLNDLLPTLYIPAYDKKDHSNGHRMNLY